MGLMPTKGRPQQALMNVSRVIQFAGVPVKFLLLHDESEKDFWSQSKHPNIEPVAVPSHFTCTDAVAHGLQLIKSTHVAFVADDFLCSWNWLKFCVMTSTVGLVAANLGSGWTQKFSGGLAEIAFLEELYGDERWPTGYHHFCADDEMAYRARYFGKYFYQPHAILYHLNGDLGFSDNECTNKFDHEDEDLAKYFARKKEFELQHNTKIIKPTHVFPVEYCEFEERDTACLNEEPE